MIPEACHPWTVTNRPRPRIRYASTRVDLPNVKYKPESQILRQSRTSSSSILKIFAPKQPTYYPFWKPVSVCLNPILLQSRFLSGSIARNLTSALACEIFGLVFPKRLACFVLGLFASNSDVLELAIIHLHQQLPLPVAFTAQSIGCSEPMEDLF